MARGRKRKRGRVGRKKSVRRCKVPCVRRNQTLTFKGHMDIGALHDKIGFLDETLKNKGLSINNFSFLKGN